MYLFFDWETRLNPPNPQGAVGESGCFLSPFCSASNTGILKIQGSFLPIGSSQCPQTSGLLFCPLVLLFSFLPFACLTRWQGTWGTFWSFCREKFSVLVPARPLSKPLSVMTSSLSPSKSLCIWSLETLVSEFNQTPPNHWVGGQLKMKLISLFRTTAVLDA